MNTDVGMDMDRPSASRQVSRRQLLYGLGATLTGAIALAACQSPAPPAAPTVGAAPTAAPAPTAAKPTAAGPAAAPTLAAPAAGSTAAPSPAPATAAAAVKRGGTLIWAETADPISFDPHARNNASASILQRQVYESFTRMNPRTMATEPALATSWAYTSPSELVFTLRQGVTFHNGQAFTADDAKWNVDRMVDPATANPFVSWYQAISKSEVVDKFTIKLTLSKPDPVLPEKFSAMRVSGFAPASSDPKALASKPIGTGPFKLVEWLQNDRVTLQRNGEYWDKNVPYLDTLQVKFLPQEDTRIAALRSGAADWAPVSADGARRLAGTPNLKTVQGSQAVFTVLKFNQRFAPFADVRVRQALDMAIDRKGVIDKALGGPVRSRDPSRTAGRITGFRLSNCRTSWTSRKRRACWPRRASRTGSR